MKEKPLPKLAPGDFNIFLVCAIPTVMLWWILKKQKNKEEEK